ncbi:MAG: hypothetical protein Q9207_003981 [Kuettlingeria erythrocarpa]
MVEQVELAAYDVVPDPFEGDDINSGQFRQIGGTDYTTDPVTLGLGTNGGTHNPDEQQSLAAHANDFRGQAGTSAWILFPVPDEVIEEDGSTVQVDYRAKNTKLQEEVFRLTGITVTIIEYTPDQGSDTALGRALYEYDPNAREADPEDPDLPVRGFRLIHEYTDEGIQYF